MGEGAPDGDGPGLGPFPASAFWAPRFSAATTDVAACTSKRAGPGAGRAAFGRAQSPTHVTLRREIRWLTNSSANKLLKGMWRVRRHTMVCDEMKVEDTEQALTDAVCSRVR